VLSLALGIDANTAIFTIINALLLRDLPVRQPERIVQLSLVRRDGKPPFGLSPSDLPTVAGVSLLRLLAALFAGYLPARRAWVAGFCSVPTCNHPN
jgi:hypothetical protein